MKVLKWLDEYLEEVLMGVLLICMVVVMSVQIFCRYILNNSLSWSEELMRYLFIWSAFISISYCVKKRISIKIEQFQMILPERVQYGVKVLRHTVVLIFSLYMIPFAVSYLQHTIESGQTSSALQIPMYYIQAAPLVGFVLLAIRVFQAWLREFKNLTRGTKA